MPTSAQVDHSRCKTQVLQRPVNTILKRMQHWLPAHVYPCLARNLSQETRTEKKGGRKGFAGLVRFFLSRLRGHTIGKIALQQHRGDKEGKVGRGQTRGGDNREITHRLVGLRPARSCGKMEGGGRCFRQEVAADHSPQGRRSRPLFSGVLCMYVCVFAKRLSVGCFCPSRR